MGGNKLTPTVVPVYPMTWHYTPDGKRISSLHVERKVSWIILIRSNKMQQYAGIYLLQNHSLHVSGVHCTHHQEYIKL